MSIPMTIIAGLDVGNGYTKGLMRGQTGVVDSVDIPSGVALVTRPNRLPVPDSEAITTCESGFYDALDVSFASPLVGDPYRRLFGTRSLSAGGAFEEFDVVGRRSKAEQRLSRIIVLGCVAAKALRDYVAAHHELPTDMLDITARAALALPITEYMDHRVAYAAGFKEGTHTITIHNFETPVTVRVRFEDVQVQAEGASAQLAIVDKGEPLMNAMLADVRKRGMALEGITGADVLAATNSIGIDIGEGTVNFPCYTFNTGNGHGTFNPDVSTTFAKGYGNVLTEAMEAMEAMNYAAGFSSRKQLAAFLQSQPSALQRNKHVRVKAFVDEQVRFFADEVAEQLGRVMADIGGATEVIYVYGGGAGPVKEILYPTLLAKVAEMAGEDAAPVLYLDSSYSRHLNREGLFLIADLVAQKSARADK